MPWTMFPMVPLFGLRLLCDVGGGVRLRRRSSWLVLRFRLNVELAVEELRSSLRLNSLLLVSELAWLSDLMMWSFWCSSSSPSTMMVGGWRMCVGGVGVVVAEVLCTGRTGVCTVRTSRERDISFVFGCSRDEDGSWRRFP